MRRRWTLAIILFSGSWSAARAAAPGAISPEELYARIVRNSQVPTRTGAGIYIHRTVDKLRTDEMIRAQVDPAIAGLEKHRKEHPDDKPTETLEQIRTSLTDQLKQTTTTALETYSISGPRFRVERRSLPNDQALESLRVRLADPSQWPRTDTVLVGDGRSTDQLDPSPPTAEPGGPPVLGRLMRTDFSMKAPAFLSYSREAVDPNLLKAIRANSKDLPIRVAESKEEGEDVLSLHIGAPGSVGFVIEIATLPAKGYAIKRSSIMAFGQVMSREDYAGFVRTSAGFWLPTRIMRETFALDNGVVSLATREELVAARGPSGGRRARRRPVRAEARQAHGGPRPPRREGRPAPDRRDGPSGSDGLGARPALGLGPGAAPDPDPRPRRAPVRVVDLVAEAAGDAPDRRDLPCRAIISPRSAAWRPSSDAPRRCGR